MSKRGGYFDRLLRDHHTAQQTHYAMSYSDDLRTQIFADHFRSLHELTMLRFEWLNMPDTVSTTHLERLLADQGQAIFFKDADTHTGKFQCLQGHGIGRLNQNGEYSKFLITQPNWTGPREFTSDTAVMIKSNPTMTPDILRINIYANRLTELDLTFDVNARSVRRSTAVLSDQDSRTSNKRIIDAVDRGDPVIELTRDFQPKDFQVIEFGGKAQELIEINMAKQRIMGEAMTALGINNANQDKKERNVVDEVNANNEQVGAMREVAMKTRMDAVRLINMRWPGSMVNAVGTVLKPGDIEVRFRDMSIDNSLISTGSAHADETGGEE